MPKINFNKLGLKPVKNTQTIKLEGDIELEVRSYLPIAEKIDFINFIVTNALDDKTGCFSPVRTEVYFSIGVAKWYANIAFTEKQLRDIEKTYDLLETNGVIDRIIGAIPQDEIEFMQGLIDETTADIARYNNSFAGIIGTASRDTASLDDQINKLLQEVRNRDGLEVLDAIKNVVGTD